MSTPCLLSPLQAPVPVPKGHFVLHTAHQHGELAHGIYSYAGKVNFSLYLLIHFCLLFWET